MSITIQNIQNRLKHTLNLLRICLVCLCVLSFSTYKLSGKELEGGIRFHSYEKIKDHRTGLNLTPEEYINIGSEFKMNFEFGLWRNTEAYGHIFRIVDVHDGNNIDLISSPYNSKFDDLNLIVGDSMTAVSFSFEEIELLPKKWISCQLTISEREGFIALTINGIKKIKQIPVDFQQASITFGKNNMGRYTTSDVPPMCLRNVVLSSNGKTIRNWPLVRYRESFTYDETGNHKAEALNPYWIVDRHIKWQQKQNITTSSRPQIIYDQDSLIYLLTSSELLYYDLVNNKVTSTTLNKQVPVPFNQASLYHPSTNEIWLYDLDSLAINKFSISDTSYHQINSDFSVVTSHWHANRILTAEGRSIFFGGYGHYNYKNNLVSYDSTWTVSPLKEIEPRYLDAFGQNGDGDLFIFGGYGSKKGSQEYGAHAFHQLFKVDPVSLKVETLWSKEEEAGGNVFSNSMVFSNSDSVFYVLRYPRDKFNSKAILESFNLHTQEKETLGDSIALNFLDTKSYVDLILNESSQELVAVIMRMKDEQYITSLYTLKFPPVHADAVIQPEPTSYLMEAAVGLTSIICLIGIWFFQNRKSNPEPEPVTSTAKNGVDHPIVASEELELSNEAETVPAKKDFEDHKSAILFLGGFQVLDKEGNEISEKFSSTLRTLLSMLLLYSTKNGKGVPSNFIWETLWSDKSQNSARNNRNVNIKKLRDLLGKVGTVEIKNASDKWKIELGDDVFFDYGHLMDYIEKDQKINQSSLELMKRGNILPSFELDWIDPYKAELSNKVVDYLLGQRQNLHDDSPMQLDIANCILQHDIINQDALFIKVKYLNSMKKFALAKQCYESYRKEYQLLYDEEFEIPFDEIVHGHEKV